uniref:Cysteine-rich with EGF-like domain protein 2 n=1 Tax=Cacopsylla melanoneura TaxID=428564 RepID=A0A8D9BEM2_9HEMI
MLVKTSLLFLTILPFLTLVHGSISADVIMQKDSKDDKFPPCKTCKLYVESFLKGIEKTAKGNFAGGDTAWEEEKQKNYARSEVRLIEIQENMCSEVSGFSDQCHNFAADIESEIEEWWFKVQHSKEKDSDLFTWLCINNLKRCCPIDHYGPECKPCVGFPNVCFGNGKCKGNGTRKGNGQCSCNKEYQGELCNVCNTGYFQAYKDDKTILCSKCHSSCESECSSGGPKGCAKCKTGWASDKDIGCYDINECSQEDICETNKFCVNTEGSYRCMQCDPSCNGCDGDGPDMCQKCAQGYKLVDNICLNMHSKSTHSNENLYRCFVPPNIWDCSSGFLMMIHFITHCPM